MMLGERLDRSHEVPAHRRHQGRRGHHRTAVPLEEANHPTAGLQSGLVGIEVQPVDPLDVELHLVFQQFPQRLFYHCHWPRLTLGLNVLPPPVRLPTEAYYFRDQPGPPQGSSV